MRALRGTVTLLAVIGIAATGCGGNDAASAPAGDPSASAVVEAEQIFATRCLPCHGSQGRGDGPGSAGLAPRPRDFTNPQWQASVTDERIEKIIQYGGSAVGLSPVMPPNPDLATRIEVVQALRAHVRSLAGK